MKDTNLETTIMKTLEYYATINHAKAEQIEKRMIKEEIYALLQDLVEYLETGLKKKFSINLNVIITENPNYALKYEKGCLLSFQYLNYEILIYKVPYITIPNIKFSKKALSLEEEASFVNRTEILRKCLLNSENYLMLNFCSKSEKYNLIKNYNSKTFSQDSITDLIFKNIAYCLEQKVEKALFLPTLSQAIQFDLAAIHKDYSFNVVIAKKHLISTSFLATSNLVYHSRIIENSKTIMSDLEDGKSQTYTFPKLKDIEFLIYHKSCEYESVIKSIVTGKLQNVEFKHIFIFISVIIFFTLVGFCPSNPADLAGKSDITWFEENVCLNKGSYLSTIGVLFILIILSGVLKKKLNKSKKKTA